MKSILPPSPQLTRRGALTLIAVTAAGGAVMARSAFAQLSGASASTLIAGADVCAIIPEVTEGPYYFDPALVRADITEGKTGVPLTFRLQVVNAGCQPIEGARVDIWHCDATGLYSGYDGQGDAGERLSAVGETFLRGTQFADAEGVVTFQSIYPGWYRGRTTHVHFKVFLDATNVLTGQIFFDEELNQHVYTTYAPYNVRAASRDTFNAGDGIAQQAGPTSIATVSDEGEAYLAQLIIGVDPNAVSSGAAGPGGPGGGLGGPGGPPPGVPFDIRT